MDFVQLNYSYYLTSVLILTQSNDSLTTKAEKLRHVEADPPRLPGRGLQYTSYKHIDPFPSSNRRPFY